MLPIKKITGYIFLCIFLNAAMLLGYELSKFHVDFHASMEVSNGYKNIGHEEEHDKTYARADHKWRLAEELYNRYILEDLQFSDKPLIPLIVHHIWLGSMMPDYAREFRKTWIKYNPNWTFIVWTDHPATEFGSSSSVNPIPDPNE